MNTFFLFVYSSSPWLPCLHTLRCWQIHFCLFFLSNIVCHSISWMNVPCIDYKFLVLCSLFLSSSLVQFRKGQHYCTKASAQQYISLFRFLLQILVSSCLLVLLRHFFMISFSSFLFAWWNPLPIFLDICWVLFLSASWCFPDEKTHSIPFYCYYHYYYESFPHERFSSLLGL